MTRPSATAAVRFERSVGSRPKMVSAVGSPGHQFEATRWGAWVLGSMAHPVAGDHHGLRVDVGVGCCAELRSARPTVARRAPTEDGFSYAPLHSSLTVHAEVGSDSLLVWHPEPGVATDGADHRCYSTISLAGDARLLWADEFMVDRRDLTRPGTWRCRLRVVRDGWPTLCSELVIGPRSALWQSPAVLDGARAVSLVVIVDPNQPLGGWSTARHHSATTTGVALPLATPGVQLMAWGDHLADCRAAVWQMMTSGGAPAWAVQRWAAKLRRAEQAAAASAAARNRRQNDRNACIAAAASESMESRGSGPDGTGGQHRAEEESTHADDDVRDPDVRPEPARL